MLGEISSLNGVQISFYEVLYVFLGPNEQLLFAKGISGTLEDGKIVIISGNDLIKTNHNTSYDSLKQLEENYKIKLIGTFDSIKEEKFELDT